MPIKNLFLSGGDVEVVDEFASIFSSNGFKVLSKWHKRKNVVPAYNVIEMLCCDALVAVDDGCNDIEIGIAIGLKKPVVLMSDRDNDYFYPPLVFKAKDYHEVIFLLKTSNESGEERASS